MRPVHLLSWLALVFTLANISVAEPSKNEGNVDQIFSQAAKGDVGIGKETNTLATNEENDKSEDMKRKLNSDSEETKSKSRQRRGTKRKGTKSKKGKKSKT